MKSTFILRAPLQALFLLLVLAMLNTGCDLIKEPYRNQPNNPDPTDTTTAVRKVLLEEFTGHKCGNCPEGAEVATQLKNFYGSRLVVLSVHAGYFATISNNPTAPYHYDFRTPVGNALQNEYNVVAYPSAIINRTNHQVFGSTAWATVIDTILSRPAQAKIRVTPQVTPGTRELKVEVRTTFVENISQPQNLALYLTESGFVNWQKDYRLPQNAQDIPDYEHNHFLRAAITSHWGETLTTGPVAANHVVTRQYTYQVPANFNLARCKVLAIVNHPTNFQVMQVEESGYLQP